MVDTLRNWLKTNWIIITNSASLVGTTGINSALGFFYWWVAARTFQPEAVGLASAAVSAMMLLGTVGVLGFGTLLVTEIPRERTKGGKLIGSLIITSLVVSGVVAIMLGIAFGAAAPIISHELAPIAHDGMSVVIFALGVALTTVTIVLDMALMGLLRGGLQLWRNILFSISKLVILALIGLGMSSGKSGMAVYFAWTLGNVISMGAILAFLIYKHVPIVHRFEWKLLHGLGKSALAHHALNLSLQAPGMMLPIIVTIILGAATNASFYAAWMIATFVFVVPNALTTTLHAIGAAEPDVLSAKMRITMRMSLLGAVAMNAVLLVGAGLVLSLFSKAYADQAAWSLRILSLGVFPLIIKVHYITICRVHDRIAEAIKLMTIGGILELVLAAAGAYMGGLTGLSLGWSAAVCIEAAMTGAIVYRTLVPQHMAAVSLNTQS